MGKMESMFSHLRHDILIFTNTCHQNVTGKLCQDELKGTIRALQIVISSQDVYPVVRVWPCPTALSRYGSMTVHKVPVTAWYLTSHIYQLDQVTHKQGTNIHWTEGTSTMT